MYIVQTCTNVPKWGWIDVGVRDNVGTRWGHLAPEKRTQRGTAARRSLSSGHDLLFNSSKVLFEEDYELDGKRSYIFIKIKDTGRDSCE